MRQSLLSLLLTLLPIGVTLVAPSADAMNHDDEKLIAQLEEMAARQAARIERLRARVSAETQSVEQQRVELMSFQIREVLREPLFRESLMPPVMQAGYDRGFFIRSSDGLFSMKFQWFLQYRWTHYATQSHNRYLLPKFERNDRTGFDFARARFRVFGNVYSKDLTYFMSLTHAENTQYDARSIYAWLNYRFTDAFQVMIGQMRLASSRAQMRKITTYQLTELPFTDAIIGCGCGIGVRFWGKAFDHRLSWFLDVVNSWNGDGNRTITNDPPELDGTPAILLRTVWHVLGDEPGREFTYQADLEHHETPALDLGFHYAFNDDDGDRRTLRVPFHARGRNVGGAFGLVPMRGLQVHQFGLEGAFKYRGFSMISECHLRVTDVKNSSGPSLAPLFQFTGDDSTNTLVVGYVQAGYMLPIPGFENKLEAVARIEGVAGVDPGNEGTWIYTGGLNYYFDEELKIQMDVSKINEVPITASTYSLANVNDDALIWRVQMTFSF